MTYKIRHVIPEIERTVYVDIADPEEYRRKLQEEIDLLQSCLDEG